MPAYTMPPSTMASTTTAQKHRIQYSCAISRAWSALGREHAAGRTSGVPRPPRAPGRPATGQRDRARVASRPLLARDVGGHPLHLERGDVLRRALHDVLLPPRAHPRLAAGDP